MHSFLICKNKEGKKKGFVVIYNFLGKVQVGRIADVANSKCHQRLDKILIIFTCTIEEISKVVCKKTMSETCAFNNKLMLYETCALQQAYAVQTGLH